MPEFQDSVYLLSNDLDRFSHVASGEGYDLEAFSFEDVAQIRNAIAADLLPLPDPVFFYQKKARSYFDNLDSLYAAERCPIFSQRMIDVLLSVRDFRYRKYPIAVLKDRGDEDPYQDIEKFKKLSLRDDLFIFQTLEFLDVFDWEKSEYTQTDLSRELGEPGYVRKFILKTPHNGFPPLFRLNFIGSARLFISWEAREALKEAGIKGPSFTSLLRPGGNSTTDVLID
jgi:hypothetical protein